MVDHSMATTRNNNGGGSKNHLPSSSLQDDDGRPYRQTFYSSQNNSGHRKEDMLPIVFVVFTAVVLLLRLLCCGLAKDDAAAEEEREAAGAGGDRMDRPPPLENNEAGEGRVDIGREEVPPLVCTYRKADGWGEGSSCGVCLADMADGEALRVLPACMHFFHAACVNEWLGRHATCPLCRAPLVAPGPGDGT